jgi:hypothetical protein
MKAPKILVRPLVAVSFGVLLPMLAGCPKKPDVTVPDAAPVAVVVPDAAPVDLTTTDDSGVDAGIDAALPAHHPGGNANVAKIKACCNALRTQAKAMGSSPEGGVILGIASQCDAVAVQAGTAGTAPELAVIRNMMKGRTIPSVCQ